MTFADWVSSGRVARLARRGSRYVLARAEWRRVEARARELAAAARPVRARTEAQLVETLAALRARLEMPARLYVETLAAQPLLTNSVTAACLYGGGDIAAQQIERRSNVSSPQKSGWNYGRTLRMTFFGFAFAGPILNGWYPLLHKVTAAFRRNYQPVSVIPLPQWLESRLPGWVPSPPAWATIVQVEHLASPSDRAREVAVKVLFDNLFFQAPFLTCYFVVTGFLEGLSPAAVYHKTQTNFHAAWAYGVLLWAPLQTANFWFVPVGLQPLAVNIVNVFWKGFLSLLNHRRDYGGDSAKAAPAEHAVRQREAQQRLQVEELELELASQRKVILRLTHELELCESQSSFQGRQPPRIRAAGAAPAPPPELAASGEGADEYQHEKPPPAPPPPPPPLACASSGAS